MKYKLTIKSPDRVANYNLVTLMNEQHHNIPKNYRITDLLLESECGKPATFSGSVLSSREIEDPDRIVMVGFYHHGIVWDRSTHALEIDGTEDGIDIVFKVQLAIKS